MTQVCHPDRSAPSGKACHYDACQATHWQPVLLARQSTGPSSHWAASPVCARGPGIWPFAPRSGLRAVLGQQQEEQRAVPSGEKSQLSREARSWTSKQALPCAPGSRPRGILPSGGSSAVTFLHVLGRRGAGAGACWLPQGSSTVCLKGTRCEREPRPSRLIRWAVSESHSPVITELWSHWCSVTGDRAAGLQPGPQDGRQLITGDPARGQLLDHW